MTMDIKQTIAVLATWLCCYPQAHAQTVKRIDYKWDDTGHYHRLEHYDSQGVLTKVEDNGFIIPSVGETTYVGMYRDGIPYEGYFKTDTLLQNFPVISRYEAGVLQEQFFVDHFTVMNESSRLVYDLRTVYESGRIKNGIDYHESDLNGGTMIRMSHYKDFTLSKIVVDLFAMHYFGRMEFELKGDTLQFDLREPDFSLQTNIYKKNQRLLADVFQSGTLLGTVMNEEKQVPKGSPNSTLVYSLDSNRQLQERSFIEIKNGIETVYDKINGSSALLEGLLDILPARYPQDTKFLFARLHQLLLKMEKELESDKQSEEERGMKSYALWSRLFYEQDETSPHGERYLTSASFNEHGDTIGWMITPLPDGTYQLDYCMGKKLHSLVVHELTPDIFRFNERPQRED